LLGRRISLLTGTGGVLFKQLVFLSPPVGGTEAGDT
jgi:hypothetical protein